MPIDTPYLTLANKISLTSFNQPHSCLVAWNPAKANPLSKKFTNKNTHIITMHSFDNRMKWTTTLVFACVVLLLQASPIHAMESTALFGDRDTVGTFVNSCWNHIMTRNLDSGGEMSFRLNKGEWEIFKVEQDADIGCDCTITCLDTTARVDLYVTFERRARLNDNWDGWACKETLASHTQTCQALAPEPQSTCRVAVHGYLFQQRYSECTLVCTVDAAPCRGCP